METKLHFGYGFVTLIHTVTLYVAHRFIPHSSLDYIFAKYLGFIGISFEIRIKPLHPMTQCTLSRVIITFVIVE